MITLTVTEDQAHMIRYALGELANKRKEQAIDYSTSDRCRSLACHTEAHELRRLQERVADRIKAHTTKSIDELVIPAFKPLKCPLP